MTTRRDELDQSADSIEELIEVLDQRKDEAIERTFKQVARNFAEVFEQLVPQGRGRLIMQKRAGGVLADDEEEEDEEEEEEVVQEDSDEVDDDDDDEAEDLDEDEESDDEPAAKRAKKGKNATSKPNDKTNGKSKSNSGAGSGKGKGKSSKSVSSKSGSKKATTSSNRKSKKTKISSYTGISIKVSFNSKSDEGQRIQQLSGGQKSIVALTLIFAIQRCDPAPFYLFDEIDANLDADRRTAVAGEWFAGARTHAHTHLPSVRPVACRLATRSSLLVMDVRE